MNTFTFIYVNEIILRKVFLFFLFFTKILFCQSTLSSNFTSNTNCILKNNPVNFSDASSISLNEISQ